MTVVVDVANVMGSRPDGWWRDRAGAAARMHAAIARLAASGGAALPDTARPDDTARPAHAVAPGLSGLEGAAKALPFRLNPARARSRTRRIRSGPGRIRRAGGTMRSWPRCRHRQEGAWS